MLHVLRESVVIATGQNEAWVRCMKLCGPTAQLAKFRMQLEALCIGIPERIKQELEARQGVFTASQEAAVCLGISSKQEQTNCEIRSDGVLCPEGRVSA